MLKEGVAKKTCATLCSGFLNGLDAGHGNAAQAEAPNEQLGPILQTGSSNRLVCIVEDLSERSKRRYLRRGRLKMSGVEPGWTN